MRFLTEIHSQTLSITTRIIPETAEEAKELVGIDQELRGYVRPHVSQRILVIIQEGFRGNTYYVIFNLRELGGTCLAEYFIDAMKFSQDLFHWLSYVKFPNRFPRGWEVRVV